jgi:hypothetical protein
LKNGVIKVSLKNSPWKFSPVWFCQESQIPLDPEAPLIVTFHLRTQSHDEAAPRKPSQIPADIGEDHGAARKGKRDAGADAQAAAVLGG